VKTNNPKAYPYNFLILTGSDDVSPENLKDLERTIHTKDAGMTLLDYFAGQALVTLKRQIQDNDTFYHEIAEKAYHIAEAMLEEREKRI